jgi:hypothetical protein
MDSPRLAVHLSTTKTSLVYYGMPSQFSVLSKQNRPIYIFPQSQSASTSGPDHRRADAISHILEFPEMIS